MMSLPTLCYLSLGSNLGDRAGHLRWAIERIASTPGILSVRSSPFYETEPVGLVDQPWFVNAVLEVLTTTKPLGLLALAKGLEAEAGRVPGERWGPRPLDVDILTWGLARFSIPGLSVPHPEMLRRLFVLVPLRDLKPDWCSPDGTPIDVLIRRLEGQQRVYRYPSVGSARRPRN